MKNHRVSFIKRAAAVVACAALAVSLMPAQAFALGEITEWSAPPKSDTSYVKDGKTYTYITSAAHRRCEAVADYLGISNVTVQPMRTGKAFPYQEEAAAAYKIAASTGRMGIFGTTVKEIAEANGLIYPYTIYPGQELVLPIENIQSPRYYVVRPGDTILGIAERYGLEIENLLALNNLENPNIIYPGQILRLTR